MKYIVNAYIEKSMKGLVATLETKYWTEVEEFIWDKCQRGYNCTFTGDSCGVAYADRFTKNTVDVDELIIYENKATLYTDLLMEQQEQM